MAKRLAPKKTPKKVVAPRLIEQKAAHVATLDLKRRDGSGVLIGSVIDFTEGTVQFRQPTTPITFKGSTIVADIEDVIEFFTAVRDYVANPPASVLTFDEDETDEAAPAA